MRNPTLPSHRNAASTAGRPGVLQVASSHATVCIGLGALALLCCLASTAGSRPLETRDKAFARLFPSDCDIERRTIFLSQAQIDTIQKSAHVRLEHARVSYYVVSRGDSLLARAYLDMHVVRSKREILLFVLEPAGGLRSVDVLAFDEPQDYLPTPRWYQRLATLPHPEHALFGQDIDAVSGATLSVRAAAAALRRICGIDAVITGRIQTETP